MPFGLLLMPAFRYQAEMQHRNGAARQHRSFLQRGSLCLLSPKARPRAVEAARGAAKFHEHIMGARESPEARRYKRQLIVL